MATVRPFPIAPVLLMNIVPPASQKTSNKTVFGLINNVNQYVAGQEISDLGSFFSASNVTSLRDYGIIISQIALTQKPGYLSSTQDIPTSEITDLCPPPVLQIPNPNVLGGTIDINVINRFTTGQNY
jgi:hypothetical protein